MHRFLLHNDEVREAGQKLVDPGQVGLFAGWGVFSTLRVSKGVLFAWERHYARMHKDARMMRVPFPDDAGWLEAQLHKLVEANKAYDATLRVYVVRNKGGIWEGPGIERPYDIIAFTTGLTDWGKGVNLAVVPHGRHAESRFAGTKVLSWGANLTWYEEAHDRGFDEVVLLNERGEVSELTSANIFAVNGNVVSTPPLSSGCLPGVTRALLLEEVKVPGLRIEEKTLMLEDLENADEVFITSTTRDVLPVLRVEGIRIKPPGEVSAKLRAAFTQLIDDYVCSRVGA